MALVKKLAEASRKEPGVMHFDVLQRAQPTSQFATCFARSQGKQSAAWVYVAGHGASGAFSSVAEPGVREPYFLLLTDRGTRRDIAVQGVVHGSVQARGVSQCI